MRKLVKNFPIFCAGVLQASKTAKMGPFEGVFLIGLQLKRHNFRQWESFWGLVDSQRMCFCASVPLPSAIQHPSYGDCLEVQREYYQNCSVLDCVTQCSQSTAHLYEQFLQVQHIVLVILGPLRCV